MHGYCQRLLWPWEGTTVDTPCMLQEQRSWVQVQWTAWWPFSAASSVKLLEPGPAGRHKTSND